MGSERKSQTDKFKDLARAVEADEDEQKFNDTLRRIGYHDTAGKEQKDEKK